MQKTRTKTRDTEGYWRLPSSPIVGEKHVVSLCKFKSVLIYTRIAKPFILPLQIVAFTKIIYFDLYPHHGVKFKSVLIYIRIAKPFVLPLQMFAFTKIKIAFCKTAARIAASEPTWRLPSSPIVKKKHVVSLCQLFNANMKSQIMYKAI